MHKMSNEISFISLQIKAMLVLDKAAFSAPRSWGSLSLKFKQVMEVTRACDGGWRVLRDTQQRNWAAI